MSISNLDASRWRRRPLILALAVLLALVWFYGLVLRPRSFHGTPPLALTQNLDHLRKHVSTKQFTYAQRMIRTRPFRGERSELTVVNHEPLFPTDEIIIQPADGGVKARVGTSPLPPLELAVPQSPKANAAIMSFGVATSMSRLKDASAQFGHWLAGSGAPLHVLAPPEDTAVAMQAQMRSMGIDATIDISPIEKFGLRYFSLIKKLYETRRPNTKWLVIVDDDTFFPSLPAVVEHFTANYHHEKQVMVAAMSDNIEQLNTWGLQPFGGGGIFISVPLAARLTTPHIWEQCTNTEGQGDQILNRCLTHFTDVRPHFDHALHQMDIMGPGDTPAGYFESGRRMLSVHHWRSWFRVDIPAAARVARACGSEGIFQRWAFPEANIVLANGFSIAEYPKGLDYLDLAAVEKTWSGDEAKFLHKIGPLRKAVGEDKISYRLMASEVVDRWFVRQTYVRKASARTDVPPEMDGVLELLWLL